MIFFTITLQPVSGAKSAGKKLWTKIVPGHVCEYSGIFSKISRKDKCRLGYCFYHGTAVAVAVK